MAKKKAPPTRRRTAAVKKGAVATRARAGKAAPPPSRRKKAVTARPRVTRKAAKKMAREIADDIAEKAARRSAALARASKLATKEATKEATKQVRKEGKPKGRPLSESTPIDSLDAIAAEKREELESYCRTYRQAQNDIDDLNAVREALYPAIEQLARELGLVDVYREGEWRLVLTQGRTSSLSKERLVELGVSLDTIEQAKRESTWEKYQVLVPKSGEE